MKSHIYQWVHFESQTLYDVGILEDGTLHNPRGYPEQDVRAAVQSAIERRQIRRSKAARQAAETRSKRRRLRIQLISRKLAEGQGIGNRSSCAICGRALADPTSIERGIGSECWQDILEALQQIGASGVV